jgi:hypothetical protein
VEREDVRSSTSIETAFIAFFCTATGKGDVSIPRVLVHILAIWFLTADKQYFRTRKRMLHPVIVEEFGERRGGGNFGGERKARRRDDADDEGYGGTTGL